MKHQSTIKRVQRVWNLNAVRRDAARGRKADKSNKRACLQTKERAKNLDKGQPVWARHIQQHVGSDTLGQTCWVRRAKGMLVKARGATAKDILVRARGVTAKRPPA